MLTMFHPSQLLIAIYARSYARADVEKGRRQHKEENRIQTKNQQKLILKLLFNYITWVAIKASRN